MKLLLIGSITHSFATYKEGVKERFGGGVMYGGRTAASLGIETTVLTIGAEDIEPGINELRSLGVEVIRISRETSNNFSNDYTVTPRRMYLKSFIEQPLRRDETEVDLSGYDCVSFYPLYREISDDLYSLFSNSPLVMLDPQGFTRRLDEINESGLYPIRQSNWENIGDFVGYINVLKLSSEDLKHIELKGEESTYEEKCSALVEMGFPLVILTNSEGPTIVVGKNHSLTHVPINKVDVKDPAGAGDVFGVAFAYKYLESHDPTDSAKFANTCAALKISGQKYDVKSVEEAMIA